MKKEGINKIFELLFLILSLGAIVYFGYQVFNDYIDDNNHAYETKISNLESEVKLLKDLNKIYKGYSNDTVTVSNTSEVIGFTIDGKSLSLEEVLDYSNNLLNERNMYKSILDLIKEKYGISFYEKDNKIFIEEIPNGVYQSLEKENTSLKQLLKDFENKSNTKIIKKSNDSIN